MREKILERDTLGKKENRENDSNLPNPKSTPKSIWIISKVFPAIASPNSLRKAAAISFLLVLQCYSLLVGCSVVGGFISPNQLNVSGYGYKVAKSFQSPSFTISYANFAGF